ncbi:uncharacterized protein J4E84_001601 [Alternaria hordeiaustralica]|uniref:uncharacterized protein n=1 Tax=Alternaria hordeiaustralica TaxID=1187925 RepID=UPI0020C2B375|nr:uncharacterized protein J4E84_001601 [Alternaria hordeiaustralica]KAI4694977.1 hypothetical protein J4E84_001601 [Alternaria hordeiaustralica]
MAPPNPPPRDASMFGTYLPPSARHGVQEARRPPHNSGPMFNPHHRINEAISALCAIRHSMSELETQHRSALETKDAKIATLQQSFKNLNTLHRTSKARIDDKVLLQGKLQNDIKILKRELAAEKAKKGVVDQDMEKRVIEVRQQNALLTAKVLGLEKELADERARGKENRDAKRELEVMKTKLADMVKGGKVKVEVVE